jgi:hypothetical protein
MDQRLNLGMRILQGSSPRRYYVDTKGRRVLVGLTMEETSEFEQLDRLEFLDAVHITGKNLVEAAIVSRQQRWLALYMTHDVAWKSWMAESKHQSF